MGAALAVLALLLAPAAGQDPLATLRRTHPRLIATDEDLVRVRKLVASDPAARAIYQRLQAEAAKIETAPTVEHKLIGPRLLAQSRRCLDRVYTLALLYRLNGERRYLERALRELRAAAAFPDWNPSHFLDTAEMTHAFAIGYDWLYAALGVEDRALLRRAIVEKGINQALPFYRDASHWVAVRHNWNQVCNGGIGIGALAVAEDEPEKARYVLEHALESIKLPMAEYEPDGGWAEGPGYWHYATRYNVYFLAALESALGTDFGLSGQNGFQKAGRFRICFTSPAGLTFNYADASPRAEAAAEMFWLARRYSDPVYAWDEQRHLKDAGDALDLIWYQPRALTPRQAGWPLDAVFRGVEVAFLRGDWEDPDAAFIGVKGGDNAANHSHLDLGSFVLDAGRVRWALDLGPDDYNLPGYFGPRRWTYYRLRTESHNTLLIDGENQDPKAKARITGQHLSPKLSDVYIDLTGAYPGKLKRWVRGVAMGRRRYFAVLDTLSSFRPVEVEWGMLTDASLEVKGNRALLSKNGWVLDAEVLFPAYTNFEVRPANPAPPENPNTGVRKLAVRLRNKVTQAQILVGFTPRRAGERAARFNWKAWAESPSF